MIITAPTDSIRVAPVLERQDLSLIRSIGESPVALIADCLHRMGVMDHGIRPVTSHSVMTGTIYPILCREGDNLAIHRALDEVAPGDVLVINGAGEQHRALFGGVLGEACIELGVAGVVIDGSVRDVGDLDRMGLPVYARAVTPAGPYKNGPGAAGEAVACGNLVCYPGEAIIGDQDGLVVIRSADLDVLPGLLRRQTEVEEAMRTRISHLSRPPRAVGSSSARADARAATEGES